MKDFNEILDYFLVEIEKNPNKNVEDVIIEVATSFHDSGTNLSDEDILAIRNSLNCINDLTRNINDLRSSNSTKKEWLYKRIDTKFNTIPFLNEERKSQLLHSISDKVEEMLNNQVNLSKEEV